MSKVQRPEVSIRLFSLSPSVCGTDSAHGPHPRKQYEGLFMLNANHGSDHHIRCKCIFAIAKHFLELTGKKYFERESVSNSQKVPGKSESLV